MLIVPGMDWPPKQYAPAFAQVAHDTAWWQGDLKQIQAHTTKPAPRPYQSRAQFNGGIMGAAARGVLGRPQLSGSATIERHLPIAQELVEAKGSMLLGSPPKITVHPDDEHNSRAVETLSRMTSTDDYSASLASLGQNLSAMGWMFGRVRWNQTVDVDPWIEWVDADSAIPEFEWGKLKAVHFFDTHIRDKHVYRLVETHTIGRIESQLYEGTESKLGHPVPFNTIPETTHLAEEGITDENAGMNTGIPWMTAWMIPNRGRNQKWRTHPQLRFLGMSDIQAAAGVLQDVDKAYTELWHEVDAGRARMMVSDSFLTHGGPGQGQVFDWWQDVFPLAAGGNADEAGRIEPVQFDIRTQAYLDALEVPMVRAVGAWGLSPITVGMDPTATGAMTATEIRAKSDRTLNTFRTSARHIRAGLSMLETARLSIAAQLHGFAPPSKPVNVAMVEPIQDTELDRAKTVQEWHAAEAVSLRHRVRTLHPEWDDTQVEAEVEEIRAEQRAMSPVDPFLLTTGPDEPPAGNPHERDPKDMKLAADALGVLIRAGVDKEDAARAVGITDVAFVAGLMPTSLKSATSEE